MKRKFWKSLKKWRKATWKFTKLDKELFWKWDNSEIDVAIKNSDKLSSLQVVMIIQNLYKNLNIRNGND